MARLDLEKAKQMYPSTAYGVDEWMAFFRTSEGSAAFAKILYDMLDEVLSIEEKERGLKRIGRRPARQSMPMREIERRLFPGEFSNDPFPEAVEKLWPKGKTQVQFVRNLPISQPTLSTLLSGKTQLTRQYLEVIADGLGVQPAHFAEWRAFYILELLGEFLAQNPHQSIGFIKTIRRARGALPK